MEFDTEADSTDKSQPFDIKTEDITEHDDKPRPYLCTVCDKQFTRKKYLNAHRQIHTVYPCSECEKSFSSQDALRRHKNIHTGKYKCTECGRCCQSSYDLATHRRSHSGEQPFECSVCGSRFTRAESLSLIHI